MKMNGAIYDELMRMKADGSYIALVEYIEQLNSRVSMLNERAAKYLVKADDYPKFDLLDAVRYVNYYLGEDTSIRIDRKFDSIAIRITDFSSSTSLASEMVINERELKDDKVGALNYRFKDAVSSIEREKEQ